MDPFIRLLSWFLWEFHTFDLITFTPPPAPPRGNTTFHAHVCIFLNNLSTPINATCILRDVWHPLGHTILPGTTHWRKQNAPLSGASHSPSVRGGDSWTSSHPTGAWRLAWFAQQPQWLRVHKHRGPAMSGRYWFAPVFLDLAIPVFPPFVCPQPQGRDEMSHVWLSTLLRWILCSLTSCEFPITHCPLHKETSLVRPESCSKGRDTGVEGAVWCYVSLAE